MGAQIVVGILTPAISFLFAIVFCVFWRKRPDLYYVKLFAISYALVGLAFGHTIFMPASQISLSLPISVSLGLLSIVFACSAFLYRHNANATTKLFFVYWALGTVGALIAVLKYQNATYVAICGCAFACLMFFTISHRLRQVEHSSEVDRYIPKILFVTASVMSVQTAFIIVKNPVIDTSTLMQSDMWITLNMIIIMQCCAVAVAVAMIAVIDSMTIVSQQAMTDELSGLQRRERFEALALENMEKAQRGDIPVTLIVCDLDHFKNINDTYGHLSGDEVIKAFGAIMRQTARSTDILGRIGGEEFALLLWNSDVTGAKIVAQQLRSTLSNLDLSEVLGDTNCTASFGIAQWNGHDEYREMFAMADKALYHAKHSGRDCIKAAQAEISLAA